MANALDDSPRVLGVGEVNPLAPAKIAELAAEVPDHHTERARPQHVRVVARVAGHQHVAEAEAPALSEVPDGAALRSPGRQNIQKLVV